MTLTILDDCISSDHTRHTARRAADHQGGWHVSWLPGRLLDHNTAITAMVLADVVGDVDAGHPLWPHIQSWAAELDLPTPDAVAWASRPPDRISVEKDAAIPEDPEAAGS